MKKKRAATKLQYLESFYWFTFWNDLAHIQSDLTKLIMFDSIVNQNANHDLICEQKTFDSAIDTLFGDE